MSKKIIATVRLAPGEIGYYDGLSGIYLTNTAPVADIVEGTNTKQLLVSVISRRLLLLSGSLGELKNPFISAPKKEEAAEVKEEAPAVQEEIPAPAAEEVAVVEETPAEPEPEAVAEPETPIEETATVQEEIPAEEAPVEEAAAEDAKPSKRGRAKKDKE